MGRTTGNGKSSKATSGRRRDAEVLEAAAKVFYERGYANASVQDVADALGILKGSLYYYIKTKEDLLFWLLEEVHAEVEVILDETRERDELGPMEKLELYVRRQVEHNVQNLPRISVYYNDLERLSPKRRADIYARRRVHEEYVTDLIRQAQEAGDADPSMPPEIAANCVFATIIWVYRWYRPRGQVHPKKLARMCAQFALTGVRGEGSTPPPVEEP